MIEPMKEMAGFIVMVFPLAQFVAIFNWSNMGKFMAVGLTDLLEQAGMSGVPAFVGWRYCRHFSVCLSPAARQSGPFWRRSLCRCLCCSGFIRPLPRYCSASRIRRSQLLAPVSPFVPLFLGFLQRYRSDAKLGTYYSLVLPYPLIFLVVWLLMLVIWYWLGLPIGPGIYPRLS